MGARAHCIGTSTDQQVHTEDDTLELQSDVGEDADQADQRDDDRQRLRFAVARSDEVSDGGDVLLFADHHHFLQYPRRADQQQYRPEVNRQE